MMIFILEEVGFGHAKFVDGPFGENTLIGFGGIYSGSGIARCGKFIA